MTKKQKRGNIIIPVMIMLVLTLVVMYKLELDSSYHISLNVVNASGQEHEINNKDLRESLTAKTNNLKDAVSEYLSKD